MRQSADGRERADGDAFRADTAATVFMIYFIASLFISSQETVRVSVETSKLGKNRASCADSSRTSAEASDPSVAIVGANQ